MDDFKKFQTPPTFPKLGVRTAALRSQTPVVNSRQELKTKITGAMSRDKTLNPKWDHKQVDEIRDKNISNPSLGARANSGQGGYVIGERLRGETHKATEDRRGPTSDLATKQHEDWHGVMTQVGEEHGNPARQSLAFNLVHQAKKYSGKNSGENGPLDWFIGEHVSRAYNPSSPLFHEEVIGKLHNYLNDPAERRFIAKFHFGSDKVPVNVDAGLKAAWRHIQDSAQNHADKSWLHPTMSNLKKPHSVSGDVLERSESDLSKSDPINDLAAHPTPEHAEAHLRSLPNNKKVEFLNAVGEKNSRISAEKTGDPNAALLYHGTPHHKQIEANGFGLTSGTRSTGFMGGQKTVQNQGVFLSSHPGLAEYFGQNRANHPADSKVLKVYANLGNTLDMTKLPPDLNRMAVGKVNQYNGKNQRKLLLGDHHWVLDDPEFVNSVKAAGYHSAVFPESREVSKLSGVPGATTTMVFDPSRLQVHRPHISSVKDAWNLARAGLSKSESEPDVQEVSLIQVTNGSGQLLLGKRNDNGRWTLPGGHLNPGEDPEAGAYRELYEETGLKPESLSYLRTVEPRVPGTPRIHCFTALAFGDAHSSNDPDQECDKWVWTDIRDGLPQKIWDKLHGPEGDENIVREAFDIKKAEGLVKSDTTDLLQHPDPTERGMALKLDSTTAQDVLRACLDHDPIVWRQALLHPQAGLAHRVLAASSHYEDEPLHDRHLAMLEDPGLSHDLLDSLYHTVLEDNSKDEASKNDILNRIAGHSGFANPELKKHWGHDLISEGSDSINAADASKEETLPHLKHLEQAYHQQIAKAEPLHPETALAETGGTSPKVVYGDIRVDGHPDTRHFMVKPYHEYVSNAGWNEASSQALYHAAGIGHLHQQSFTAPHGDSNKNLVPATVIHIEEAKPVHKLRTSDIKPEMAPDADKIGLMDFLTSNQDRHVGNLMLRPNGKLLAIDHGICLNNPGQSYLHHATDDAVDCVRDFHPEDHINNLKWWKTVGPDIRRAMDQRLSILHDKQKAEHIKDHFDARANWLDTAAKTAEAGQEPNWSEYPAVQKKMTKAIGDHEADRILSPGKGIAQGFVGKHPESADAGAQEFHTHVLGPVEAVKPAVGNGPGGIEPKTVYQGPSTRFMMKSFHPVIDRNSGWNESVSQAVYHAVGMGDYHQNSHVVSHSPDRHAVIIHMKPDHMTLDQDIRMNPANGMRRDKTISNPEHSEALRRIHMLDQALYNPDRHESNLMLAPDGRPLAIDNGMSFMQDHLNAEDDRHNPETYRHDHVNSAARFTSHDPGSENTKTWLDAMKPVIQKTVEEHIAKYPDPGYRKRFLKSFKDRLGQI